MYHVEDFATLSFGKRRPELEALENGWCEPEESHVWSSGLYSTILIKIDQLAPRSRITIAATPKIEPDLSEQRVSVFANGLLLHYTHLKPNQMIDMPIPDHVSASIAMQGQLHLGLVLPDARASRGGRDTRVLGLALHKIEIRGHS